MSKRQRTKFWLRQWDAWKQAAWKRGDGKTKVYLFIAKPLWVSTSVATLIHSSSLGPCVLIVSYRFCISTLLYWWIRNSSPQILGQHLNQFSQRCSLSFWFSSQTEPSFSQVPLKSSSDLSLWIYMQKIGRRDSIFLSHLTYYLPHLILKPSGFEHWKVRGGSKRGQSIIPWLTWFWVIFMFHMIGRLMHTFLCVYFFHPSFQNAFLCLDALLCSTSLS